VILEVLHHGNTDSVTEGHALHTGGDMALRKVRGPLRVGGPNGPRRCGGTWTHLILSLTRRWSVAREDRQRLVVTRAGKQVGPHGKPLPHGPGEEVC